MCTMYIQLLLRSILKVFTNLLLKLVCGVLILLFNYVNTMLTKYVYHDVSYIRRGCRLPACRLLYLR